MAVAAIAFTGCEGHGSEPSSQSGGKGDVNGPYYSNAYFLPQEVINCTAFSIDEGDGKGEHTLDPSRWTVLDKESAEGKYFMTEIRKQNATSYALEHDTVSDSEIADVRQLLISDTRERTIKISIKIIDENKIPTANFKGLCGTMYIKVTKDQSVSRSANITERVYTYNADDKTANVENIRKFTNKICR